MSPGSEGSESNQASVTTSAIESLSDSLSKLKHKGRKIVNLKLAWGSIAKVEGDASVAYVRGKKKTFFELSFKIPYELTFETVGSENKEGVYVAKGEVNIPCFDEDVDTEVIMSLTFHTQLFQGHLSLTHTHTHCI